MSKHDDKLIKRTAMLKIFCGRRIYVRRPPNSSYKPQYTLKTDKHGGAKIYIFYLFIMKNQKISKSYRKLSRMFGKTFSLEKSD